MSVKVMGLVWDIEGLTSAEKLVLLAYADHASHDGSGIWPSINKIARKTSLSRRTVQRATKNLEDMGWLINYGHHESGTNLWRIPIPYIGGDTMTPPGVQEIHPPSDTMTPKPSFNHQLEPLEEGEGQSNLFQLYESLIGPLTPGISDELGSLEDDYPVMWIEDAFKIAKKNKAKSVKYITAILARWNANGKDDGYKKNGKKKQVDLSAFDEWEREHANDNI